MAKVLMKDSSVKERWREYFNKLLNEDSIGDMRTRDDTLLARHTFFHRIWIVEVKKKKKKRTLIQIKTRNITGPYDIPIKA